MSVKGMAVSAAEMVGTSMVERGANKAIQAFPAQKQNKIRGFLMIASAFMLFRSGLKLIKRNRNLNG
jgi:hypothetical protein